MTDINKEYEKEYYDEYRNNYYNPDDDDGEPGINLNWKRIQKGFKKAETSDAEINEKLDDAISDINQLQTDVGQLQTDVGQLQTDVGQLQTDVGEINDDITALKEAVHFIDVSDLPAVGEGMYTLGNVTVGAPIIFNNIENRKISIIDTVFYIDTSVLFPAPDDNRYFILPNFVGCTFINVTNGRVLITAGGTDTVGSRFTNCYFNDVDMISDCNYVQDFNLTNCYIKSHEIFFECPTTVQARLVSCTIEAESKRLIDTTKCFLYMSGTYEGNKTQDHYLITCDYGLFEFDSCYFEDEKLLEMTSVQSKAGSISFTGCYISGGATTDHLLIKIERPDKTNLYIINTDFAAYSRNSRFTDISADQFLSVTGYFNKSGSTEIAYPFGGIPATEYSIATEKTANSRFYYGTDRFTSDVIAAGGITHELPVGTYLITIGKGQYSVMATINQYIVGASTENSVYTNIISLVSDLGTISVTATKESPSSQTFDFNINLVNPNTLFVSIIKMS